MCIRTSWPGRILNISKMAAPMDQIHLRKLHGLLEKKNCSHTYNLWAKKPIHGFFSYYMGFRKICMYLKIDWLIDCFIFCPVFTVFSYITSFHGLVTSTSNKFMLTPASHQLTTQPWAQRRVTQNRERYLKNDEQF